MYENQQTHLKTIKRTGQIVAFDRNKITIAIKNAFLSSGHDENNIDALNTKASAITENVVNLLEKRYSALGAVNIEEIQDQVELSLMRGGDYQVARHYILYREEHNQKRTTKTPDVNEFVTIANTDGSSSELKISHLAQKVQQMMSSIENVDASAIMAETKKNIFDGIDPNALNEALIMASRVFIEKEYNYSFVAARFLLDKIANNALRLLKISDNANYSQLTQYYVEALPATIAFGAENGYYDKKLTSLFDLEKLSNALNPQNDLQFDYLGLRTVYDRYLINHKKTQFELPQIFFMRVAMGLALEEENPTARAIEFYKLLSSFDFMSSTPTLFNAGCPHSQLSSCYLTTVPDDLGGIYDSIKDNALLSKWAGGLGNDWTSVRSLGARIKGTNGESQGIVPFLKVVNDTAVAVNQGGKRKGATCAYLETWHMDIEEFLELRKNTGDERRRTHDMNTANWIPDLFMKRVIEEKPWTLFSPHETPELHELYGQSFEKKYAEYEQLAQDGQIQYRTIAAKDLWRKIISMLFETGHPWITFKDPCNIRSPQSHVGVVHSSNLCTEITLNTSETEIAVCNLGSINLTKHIDSSTGGINKEKLQKTIKTAIRMLDNVIDINYYAVDKAKNSNQLHRPIGLGIMGFHDALLQQKISYASEQAVEFADYSMECVSYYAIEASSDLAKERGKYKTYDGSLWSQGILPIDSLDLLQKDRGEDYLDVDTSSKLDWEPIRKKIATQGMRNSNTMAIAPTATIANITGISQSIEPIYRNLFVKSNLSGEFTMVNRFLIQKLRELGLWDLAMLNELKSSDGALQNIDRIPDDIKYTYITAFEIEPKWIIEAASRRQKWIDQAQSLNLYILNPDGKMLDFIYKMAWIRGLKTTYYLRSVGATSTEKSTVNDGQLNSVSAHIEPQACLIDDPDCEACQ